MAPDVGTPGPPSRSDELGTWSGAGQSGHLDLQLAAGATELHGLEARLRARYVLTPWLSAGAEAFATPSDAGVLALLAAHF